MGKERTKFDYVVDRAVHDAIVESLNRREQEIKDNIEFASRLLAGEFDELDNETFDEPDDDNAGALDNDDDDEYSSLRSESPTLLSNEEDAERSEGYIERERRIAEDIAFILPFYGDDEGDEDDDVRLFEEMEVEEYGETILQDHDFDS